MDCLYQENGIIIYATDPGEIVSRLLARRPSSSGTHILLYRSSEYGFTSEISELNEWGRKAIVDVFKNIGLTVEFDETEREFIIQDTKQKFDFVLKHGSHHSPRGS